MNLPNQAKMGDFITRHELGGISKEKLQPRFSGLFLGFRLVSPESGRIRNF